MANPTDALASLGSAALSSLPGRVVREPVGAPSRRVVRASRDREQRLRAEARRRRFVSVCRRELLRRDAEPGRGR
jgi:hypothetical protein